MVSTELSVVFFTPAILGGFIGFLFLEAASRKTIVEQSIGLNVWVVLISNFIFQLIYYVLSRQRIVSRLD